MKLLCLLAAAALAAIASAQTPDVQVKADVGPSFRSIGGGGSDAHWYDPFGHHSTVALQFMLEPGLRAYVAQKIERIRHDGDTSQVDESYVEDPGVWRAGKQYLPFGIQRVFRESVVAIRSNTDYFLRLVPLSIAACDGGRGHQRGVVGRVGGPIGISFAFGQHFGISSTSMTEARAPDQALGVGTGYDRVVGVDASQPLGLIKFAGEFVAFRSGEHNLPDKDILDVSFSLVPSSTRSFTVGYSVATKPGIQSFRLQGQAMAAQNLWVEPWLRTKNGKLWDTGLTVRVRL